MKAKDNDIEHSEARSTGIFEKKKKEETVLVDGATSTNMSNDASQRKPRRRLRNRRTARAGGEEREPYHVDPLLLQKVLSASNLPVSAYSFEVVKTVQRCVQVNATHVALQLPEGLLLYATVLADVLTQLAPCLQQVSILSDVTYGACCVDDITAASLGCQLLVHYGHSCLVPLQHTVLPVLYVFCEIQVHVPHLVECLIATLQQQAAATSAFTTNNSASSNGSSACNHHIYLLGTVQFRHCLVTAQEMLIERGYENVTIPQCKPLSPGEVLGCTSPTLRNHDPHDNATTTSVCFVADGRFHLESTMISNPWINTFYRYDPYSKAMTVEAYDHDQMKELRSDAIARAAASQTFGIILGTLGRQGNPAIVQRILTALAKAGKRQFVVLLSEVTPTKLALLSSASSSVDCWVQVACPRLSVDWGHCLSSEKLPVLSPYELFVCLQETDWKDSYPMDYYSNTGGPWSNYYEANKERQMLLRHDDVPAATNAH